MKSMKDVKAVLDFIIIIIILQYYNYNNSIRTQKIDLKPIKTLRKLKDFH